MARAAVQVQEYIHASSGRQNWNQDTDEWKAHQHRCWRDRNYRSLTIASAKGGIWSKHKTDVWHVKSAHPLHMTLKQGCQNAAIRSAIGNHAGYGVQFSDDGTPFVEAPNRKGRCQRSVQLAGIKALTAACKLTAGNNSNLMRVMHEGGRWTDTVLMGFSGKNGSAEKRARTAAPSPGLNSGLSGIWFYNKLLFTMFTFTIVLRGNSLFSSYDII